MSKTVKVPLDYPVKINGVESSVLNFRRPTVGDVLNSRKGNAGDAEAEIRLAADLCGASPEDMRQIDLADFGKVQEVLLGFFGRK